MNASLHKTYLYALKNAFKLHFTLLNYFQLFHRFRLLGMYSKAFKHAECHGLAQVINFKMLNLYHHPRMEVPVAT